eukprot:231297-Hanusia_phi.AAC.1
MIVRPGGTTVPYVTARYAVRYDSCRWPFRSSDGQGVTGRRGPGLPRRKLKPCSMCRLHGAPHLQDGSEGREGET